MWLTVTMYAPLSLLTVVLPYPLALPSHQPVGAFSGVTAETYLRGSTIAWTGSSICPPGAAMILAKHQSAWETIAFQQIFPPQTWVLKRELLWIPLFGWALALMRPIAIDRGAGRVAIEQVIEQGRERLQSGIWVVVFPEGTRVAPGTRKRYAMGGAILAAETGYPVVPVAHNAGSFWLRRGFLKKPGTVRVVIGPTIDPRGKKAEEIIKQTEEWIEGRMVELER